MHVRNVNPNNAILACQSIARAQTHTRATGTPPGSPYEPLHPVAPSFVHPVWHWPQILPPGVLIHARLLWQPPLLAPAHSSTSSRGHVCKRSTRHARRLSDVTAMPQRSTPHVHKLLICPHKPLQSAGPSLAHPAAQSPHVRPPVADSHLRLLWHPPLFVVHPISSKGAGSGRQHYSWEGCLKWKLMLQKNASTSG